MLGSGWRGRAVVAGAVTVLLAGCGLLEQVQRIGVSSGEGEFGVLIHHVPCPGEVLTRITLATGDPDEGGNVVWEVRGRGRGGPYEVDVTPPGMWASVPPESAPTADEFHVEVETEQDGVTRTSSLSFPNGGLAPDRILTLGGAKDPETFRQDALETCKED